MFVLLFDENGLAALKLPDDITADTLLRQKQFLEHIAPHLQDLDREIKRLRQSAPCSL